MHKIKSTALRREEHFVFALQVHVVLLQGLRYQYVFDNEHHQAMQVIFSNVCEDFDAKLIDFNGHSDYVHLLVNYPPEVAVSNLVASFKGISERLLQQQFEDLRPRPMHRGKLWSSDYFAASSREAIEIIEDSLDRPYHKMSPKYFD